MAVSGALRRQATGIALDLGIIAGIAVLGYYVATKTNAGKVIQGALFGIGSQAGQAVTSPIAGVVAGVNLGTQGIVQQLTQSQNLLANQIQATTDSWNKFWHPDWYNPDGTYSTKNPNYKGAVSPSITPSIAGPASPPTTPVNNTPTGKPLPAQSPNIFNSLSAFIAQATSGQQRTLLNSSATTSNSQTSASFLATYGRQLGLIR